MHDTGCRPGTGTGDAYILHLYILRIYPVSTYGVGILYVSTRYILYIYIYIYIYMDMQMRGSSRHASSLACMTRTGHCTQRDAKTQASPFHGHAGS